MFVTRAIDVDLSTQSNGGCLVILRGKHSAPEDSTRPVTTKPTGWPVTMRDQHGGFIFSLLDFDEPLATSEASSLLQMLHSPLMMY